MKQDLKILCWLNLSIIALLVYKSFDMIMLLYDKPMTSGGITKAEYDDGFPQNNLDSPKIPKIIHQTYKTDDIPEIWKEAQQSIIDNNPDYQYIMWTDEMAREFIATNYDWFLPIFDKYKYPIMRADAIRYFILFHYGGIYIDLDNGAKQSFDGLLHAPAIFRKTHPTGVSNDIMASAAGHPFFGRLIDNLKNYKKDFIVPYITVMYSTGPLFVSMVLRKFLFSHSSLNDLNRVRVLMPESEALLGYKPVTDFFYTVQGSSWHNDDAPFIMFMLHHWILFIVLYAMLFFVLLFLTFFIELTLINALLLIAGPIFKRVASADRPRNQINSSSLFSFLSSRTNSAIERRVRSGSNQSLLDEVEKLDLGDLS